MGYLMQNYAWKVVCGRKLGVDQKMSNFPAWIVIADTHYDVMNNTSNNLSIHAESHLKIRVSST